MRSCERGSRRAIVPAGLGARDTLRLEAGMRLYGNDIDETTTVLEADLSWVVGWKKPDFIGADVLRRQKQDGVSRKLVGFEVLDRGIARHGQDVFVAGQKAGVVTSGTQTPYLKKAIGMAYVPIDHAASGADFEVDCPWPPRFGRPWSRCRFTNGRSRSRRTNNCSDGPSGPSPRG